MLQVGDKVPDFQLENQDGETVRLGDVLAGGPSVFFFYPKDFTTICTQEVCGFRDAYADLTDVQVFGVSADDVATHRRFKATYALPYSLLADTGRRVAGLFGATWPLGIGGRRATFVLDGNGIVVEAFRHELSAQSHVESVRAALKRIR
ncbi:MAG: peroxiredoxin [Sandaracinaceae bacterium]|nr:peroxiredoxin [Sandaracinaceae bacterium]